MKKLFSFITLLVGFFGVAPYFMGGSVKQHVEADIAKLNQSPNIQAEVTHYERGINRSNAELKIEYTLLDVETGTTQSIPVSTQLNILHGPVLWGNQGVNVGLMSIEMALKPQDSDALKTYNINEDTIKLYTQTHFNGNTDMLLALKAFGFAKDGVTVDIKPAEVNFVINKDQHIKGQGEFKGVSVKEGDTELMFGAAHFSLDQVIGSEEASAIFNGSSSMHLTEFKAFDKTEEKARLSNIKFDWASEVKEKTVDFLVAMNTEALVANGETFSDIGYQMTLNNLNKTALININTTLKNAKAPQEIQWALMQSLPALIADNPELEIKSLKMTTNEGDFNSKAKITVNGDQFNPSNPMEILMAIQANADGRGPEQFFVAKGMAQQIETLIAQNLLVREDKELKFDFSFDKGQALLNGQPFPLGALF
ncbi:DUF945 family protein [Pleionea sp. CnH1-48]|uniref:DUF945 family protein n=1 Tax=Pleionea sp. CnH1-48 TaxID=2954494 RepID=UPI0020981A41|nr:DUF945 family protein [Pleionea sp. CnH1-48]MCO7223479.1 YdgA family protein [Pleionea sp. CnH1-48]